MGESTTYYISEAARKIQVENHVLRYWEEELKLPIRRNEMGHRYYTEEDIKQLKEIKRLKEQGLQLKAIKSILLEGENTMQDMPQKFMVTLSKEKEENATMVVGNSQVEMTETEPVMDKSEKAARLQYLLQHMITEAVKNANQELCTDVKESILKELDYQFRMQEERDDERWKKEEEHYRKIDEMIRERHSVVKEKGKKSKRKSPIGI